MESSFLERLQQIVRSNLLPFGLGLVGLLLIVFGLVFSFPTSSESEIVFEQAPTKSGQADDSEVLSSSEEAIFVDIQGAVASPGVYELPSDARLQDVVSAAGGLLAEANHAWIARQLNLASKVTDAMKIYVPFADEEIATGTTGTTSSTGIMGSSSSNSSLISVNSASQAELETLSGVGPVTAGKIMDKRPYGSLEELVSKKAISQSLFSKLKEQLSL